MVFTREPQQAYGLKIQFESKENNLPFDILIRSAEVTLSDAQKSSFEEGCVFYSKEKAFLRWPEVGNFCVENGKKITMDPEVGVTDETLRQYLFGAVMGVLLHQRGRFVLHASSVTVNGKTAAFLGGSGWGKSTLAACLLKRGHEVLSDDVTAIEIRGAHPVVFFGVPQLRLWKESLDQLGISPEPLQRVHPDLEKRVFPVRSFSQENSPRGLDRIYIIEPQLSDSQEHALEDISSGQAMVELIRHSYCARFLSGKESETHFLQCENVLKKIQPRRLKSVRSLKRLDDLAALIEKDLVC